MLGLRVEGSRLIGFRVGFKSSRVRAWVKVTD